VGCDIWYTEEGTGLGPSPPRPLLAVPKKAHPSTASVPISGLLYNGSLLSGFYVPILVKARHLGCVISSAPVSHQRINMMLFRSTHTTNHRKPTHSSSQHCILPTIRLLVL